jgi:hypothetical protein
LSVSLKERDEMGELDVDGKIIGQEFAKFVALRPTKIIHKFR